MKISLRRRHALTAADGAFSHKIDYVTIFKEILNPKGHPNCIYGSKVTAILLNVWILPIGGASWGRVCSCSLRSRLVLNNLLNTRDRKKTILFYSGLWLEGEQVTKPGKSSVVFG